jgi:hypothetical protein
MTTTFKEFLTEGFKNLFTPEQKRKYAEEAFAQLQQSYKKVGGIHGNGFKDVEDFIKNVPFWKLRLGPDGKIIAAAYYKDKGGRKRVAISSDGTALGKKYVAMSMIEDLALGRSYGEVSSTALAFAVKMVGYDILKQYAIEPEQFAKVTGDEIFPVPENDNELKLHPELKKYFYQREIGGELHTKMALGTAGKKIE